MNRMSRMSRRMSRMSRKDQLIYKEKKYLINSMRVKRNVFYEEAILSQFLNTLGDNDIEVSEEKEEGDDSMVTLIYKESQDRFLDVIKRYFNIELIQKLYQENGFETTWKMKVDSLFYYVVKYQDLPSDIKCANHIKSHKQLDVNNLEIFHRIFGKNIIHKSLYELTEIVKKASFIKEVQDLKFADDFNFVQEDRQGRDVQIELHYFKENIKYLLEKTSLDCQYLGNHTIYVTLEKKDPFYFALTGKPIPPGNNIAKYLLIKEILEKRIVPVNLTGKRKRKSKRN